MGMNEDYRDKLKKYAQGELSAEESSEMEKELDKLQEYQSIVEEELNTQDKVNHKDLNEPAHYDHKETKGIIMRAKWKARLQNALNAIGIILLITGICTIMTALYYTKGEPSKLDTLRDVVESTIAVTEPNIVLNSGGSSTRQFFTMNLEYDVCKKVGKGEINAGDLDLSFLFSRVQKNNRRWLVDDSIRYNAHNFYHPDDNTRQSHDWSTLNKLPEGTVAEAYISFDKYYPTAEVLEKFEGKDIDLLWFAAYTGIEMGSHMNCIGFPSYPIWHDSDRINITQKVRKTGLFSRVVSEGWEYPSIMENGSAELRDKNFIDTLSLLAEHEKMVKSISHSWLDLPTRIKYLNTNGVKLYGVVVTGPSKEILKLRQESWVKNMHVGEVELWNWE